MPEPREQQRLEQLLADHAEGVLTPAAARELAAALEAAPEAVDAAAAGLLVLRLLAAGTRPALDVDQVIRALPSHPRASLATVVLNAAAVAPPPTAVPTSRQRHPGAAKRPGSSAGVSTARWLALAAGLALAVAGGLWFMLRPPALGLRLAESQGAVAVTRAGRVLPATVRLQLRDGDRVAVPEGGQAALQYDGEDTRLALHSATATFRAEKGAKRVRLDSGLLLCTAAPQRKPFRLETPHAVAEVVGTRFWLDTTVAETTLAVKTGKVSLRQQDRRLEVNAGETAVAAAAGMRKLSPADTWLRELLVQAETGPWDTVALGTGAFAQDAWRLDTRGSPAERRLWNVRADAGVANLVVFDQARWQRGVIVGRLTILPEGEPPRVLAGPAAANPQWTLHRIRDSRPVAPPGLGVMLFTGRPEKAEGLSYHLLRGNGQPRGVEHQYVLYFDLAAPTRDIVTATWPAARGYPPPAAEWLRLTERTSGPVGLGLSVTGSLALAEGLKLVPLGPDLPPPPPELRRAPHQ